MLIDLHALLGTDEIAVTVTDVDADPVLVAQYDELVPVLFGHKADGSHVRLCHYFLASEPVTTFFASELGSYR